jgi:hypothetical protein
METPFTDAELAAECRRETGLRLGVYPKLVATNKLPQDKADMQIAVMRQAAERLEGLAKSAPVSRALWATLKSERADYPEGVTISALVYAHTALLTMLLDADAAPADRQQAALRLAALSIRLAEASTPEARPLLPADSEPSAPALANEAPSAAPAPSSNVRPLSVDVNGDEAKEQLIRLLNHPVITRAEKTKVLININRYDADQTQEQITLFTQHIATREGNDVQVVARRLPADNAPAGVAA